MTTPGSNNEKEQQKDEQMNDHTENINGGAVGRRTTPYGQATDFEEELEPEVHIRSILCIVGVFFAYFAQIFGLVGSGVVRFLAPIFRSNLF